MNNFIKNKNRAVILILLVVISAVLALFSCSNTPKMTIVEGDTVVDTNYIALSIYGKDGEIILENIAVELQNADEISVFDITQFVTQEKKIHMEYNGGGQSAYIKGINNLYEFDNGASSGWLYNVNGTFESKSCGMRNVKPGDWIEWHYSEDMGKDVGNAYDME